MIEIKIILTNRNALFHSGQHIKCYVKAVEADEFAEIDFWYKDPAQIIIQSAILWPSYDSIEDDSQKRVLSLYINSKKSLEEFVVFYNENFLTIKGSFRHNCSHAVNVTLNYFFQELKYHSFFSNVNRLICSCLCISSCGGKCFSSMLRTPHEVFKKALRIQKMLLPKEKTVEKKSDFQPSI